MNVEARIAALMNARKVKEDVTRAYKDAMKVVTAELEAHEAALMEHLNANNLTQLASKDATVFVRTRDSATVGDWDTLLTFIIEGGRYDFLEKRVSSSVVKEFLADNNELPPGVKFSSVRTLSVRSK